MEASEWYEIRTKRSAEVHSVEFDTSEVDRVQYRPDLIALSSKFCLILHRRELWERKLTVSLSFIFILQFARTQKLAGRAKIASN